MEDGFLKGFRLGSQSDPARARVKVRNLPSAGLQTGAISAALRLERDKRWALGPFASPPPDVGGWAKACQAVAPRAGPKGSTDGSLKYRLIFHLSSGNPADFPGEVNGSIPRDLTVMRYPSFAGLTVCGRVGARRNNGCIGCGGSLQAAPGGLAQAAHAVGRELLGSHGSPSEWRQGPQYHDNRFGAAVQRILEASGVGSMVRMLDDHPCAGWYVRARLRGAYGLARALALLEWLGITVEPKKVQGPSQAVVFLGLRWDLGKDRVSVASQMEEALLAAGSTPRGPRGRA